MRDYGSTQVSQQRRNAHHPHEDGARLASFSDDVRAVGGGADGRATADAEREPAVRDGDSWLTHLSGVQNFGRA